MPSRPERLAAPNRAPAIPLQIKTPQKIMRRVGFYHFQIDYIGGLNMIAVNWAIGLPFPQTHELISNDNEKKVNTVLLVQALVVFFWPIRSG